MTHYKLVHKFLPVPQAMKIPDAKAAVEEARDIPAWDLEKLKSKKDVFFMEAQRDKKSPLHWDKSHLKNA